MRVQGYTKCSLCLGYPQRGIAAAAKRKQAADRRKALRKLSRRAPAGERTTIVPTKGAGMCDCGLDWMMSWNKRAFILINHKTRSAKLVMLGQNSQLLSPFGTFGNFAKSAKSAKSANDET